MRLAAPIMLFVACACVLAQSITGGSSSGGTAVNHCTYGADTAYPGASWSTAAPREKCIDENTLDGVVGTFPFAVYRDGYQVYSRGTINTTENLWSVTKSVMTSVAAMVCERDTCGTFTSAMYDQLQMIDAGGEWTYDNNRVATVANTLSGASFFNEAIEDVIQREVYDVIGGTFTCSGGIYGASCGSASIEDMARLGLLIARDGLWNVTQVIPAATVADYVTVKNPGVTLNFPLYYEHNNVGPQEFYGNLWWRNEGAVPFAPNDLVTALGASGGEGFGIYIMPALDVVAVRAEEDLRDCVDADCHWYEDQDFFQDVVNSIMDHH
jgi:CubicO group peptidase (beta-lactamase class C family)